MLLDRFLGATIIVAWEGHENGSDVLESGSRGLARGSAGAARILRCLALFTPVEGFRQQDDALASESRYRNVDAKVFVA